MEKLLTEIREGKNVIPLRQDGKTRWTLASSRFQGKPLHFLYGDAADQLAEYEKLGDPDDLKEAVSVKSSLPEIIADFILNNPETIKQCIETENRGMLKESFHYWNRNRKSLI